MPIRSLRRWGPSLLWGATILLLTSIPGRAIPAAPVIPGLDKVVHLGLYATFGWLVGGALLLSLDGAPRAEPGARGALAWAMGALALFAAADEWHQQFIPGRGADVLDWTADVAGAALALAARQTLTSTARARRETRT